LRAKDLRIDNINEKNILQINPNRDFKDRVRNKTPDEEEENHKSNNLSPKNVQILEQKREDNEANNLIMIFCHVHVQGDVDEEKN